MPAINPLLSSSEDQLLEGIRALCEIYKVTMYHTHRSDHSEPGFPDCTFIVDQPVPVVMFRELKTEGGKLTPAQEYFIETMKAAGLNVGVWRPSDWSLIVQTIRTLGVTNNARWQQRRDERLKGHLRKARRSMA